MSPGYLGGFPFPGLLGRGKWSPLTAFGVFVAALGGLLALNGIVHLLFGLGVLGSFGLVRVYVVFSNPVFLSFLPCRDWCDGACEWRGRASFCFLFGRRAIS